MSRSGTNKSINNKLPVENVQSCEYCRTCKQMMEQKKSDIVQKESQIVELNKQLFAQVEANERQVMIQKEQVRKS